ncbi:Breast cancer type 2 susceptibility protein-like protein [Auxenochlorella protothecoides]|uniref:Breast cancer type 2 susceptibility protein-like protein n=1 Tax=Auxenochlorella protothecoides TaxID=3075 RepID=A0A087SDQ9_AUXPR|nr:Breast cancer type 2 susceptibility protein-like protein [Auxenochlorella protothecoides]KFM23863.1 Breast cancer type 2 susceptibility protein-like protein [Auxenochlorella protothecoides]
MCTLLPLPEAALECLASCDPEGLRVGQEEEKTPVHNRGLRSIFLQPESSRPTDESKADAPRASASGAGALPEPSQWTQGPDPGALESCLEAAEAAAALERGRAVHPGFTTGLGAAVRVSSANLAAARKLLEEDTPASEQGPTRTSAAAAAAAPVLVAGFSTGAGAPVHVSAGRLEAARWLLDETEGAAPAAADRQGGPIGEGLVEHSPTPGFTTGLGAPVAVTSSRLEAARKLLAEEPPAAKEPCPAPATVAACFSTGLGRPVSVSPLGAGGMTPSTSGPGIKQRKKFQTPRSLGPLVRPRAAPSAPTAGTPDLPRARLHRLGRTLMAQAAEAMAVPPGQAPDAQPPASEPGEALDAAGAQAALLDAGAVAAHASLDWVANALRMVAWKTGRVEAVLGEGAAGRLQTRAMILDALRRRYELEFGRGRCPVLKAVLQHDEPAAQCMVLAVMRATPGDAAVELTDGWYRIWGRLDAPLAALCSSGRIAPGSKLRICGTTLQGAGPGDPLTAAATSSLQLCINGTHRAPDSCRLGRQWHRSTLLPLSLVDPGGGAIPRTLVVVQRVYPPLVWCSLSNGTSLMQTLRAHRATQNAATAHTEKAQTEVAARITAQERERCRTLLAETPAQELGPVQRAYARLQADAGASQGSGEDLSPAQRAALDRLVAERQAQMQAQCEAELGQAETGPEASEVMVTKAVPVQTLLLGEVRHRHRRSGTSGAPTQALCTIWRPGEEMGGVREGSIFSALGLEPRPRRGAANPEARAGLEVQTGRGTRWSLVAHDRTALPPSLEAAAAPRRAWSLACVPRGDAGEVDTAGFCLCVGPVVALGHAAQASQWAFFVDASCPAQSGDHTHPPPWLLAVRLEGAVQGMDWLDPGTHAGAVLELRDVVVGAVDADSRVQQVVADKHSSISPR